MMSYDDFLDSRNLKLYLGQIAKFPVHSEEEEKDLGRRAQQGEKEALRSLVEANLRFVVSYVKKYRGMGLGMLDLINEGNLGLIEAAKRFDPGRNVRFISYAVWWIRQAVIHALTQSSRVYNLPQKLSDQISLMKKKIAELKTEYGREPTREEIAAGMGISQEDVEDLLVLAERDVHLSDRLSDSNLEVEGQIEDRKTPPVEYQIVKSSIEQQMRDILQELDEKEATVLKLRFGLDDDRPQTLQEIGDRLSLTRERVRQIEQKAMRKLSRSHQVQQLRGYLN
ncbi:MAG: RNA polymerase sigma factor RpoD/SigA [Candidatus Aminicenantes bacterium]|nr:RNA polymerase sigma factor RpoD/SigA [Candidatus Aminicenantes bacterium]